MPRGFVVLAELGTRDGSRADGRRPVVIVQNDTGNANSPHTIVVPIAAISNTWKWRPVTVTIDPPEGGLLKASYVDCGQIHTLRWDRIVKVLGELEDRTLNAIDDALAISLNLKLASSR